MQRQVIGDVGMPGGAAAPQFAPCSLGRQRNKTRPWPRVDRRHHQQRAARLNNHFGATLRHPLSAEGTSAVSPRSFAVVSSAYPARRSSVASRTPSKEDYLDEKTEDACPLTCWPSLPCPRRPWNRELRRRCPPLPRGEISFRCPWISPGAIQQQLSHSHGEGSRGLRSPNHHPFASWRGGTPETK